MQNRNMRNFTAPYVFQEYPKHVALADGSFITVNNAEEEAAAVGADDGSTDERAELMEKARALGLNPHHKAGVEKLKQLISEAQSSQESQS